jgi:hypothetical protein
MRSNRTIPLLTLFLAIVSRAQMLDSKMHHLRAGEQREWDDFPDKAESDQLRLSFEAKANDAEESLRVRHRDLRREWKVVLNGHDLAKLAQDENAMVALIAIPPKTLRDGGNDLWIGCADKSKEADDVEIGDVSLINKARRDLTSAAKLDVTVIDQESGKPLPCRLTIVDDRGSLVPLGQESDRTTAVRCGVVYTSTGQVTLRLPVGRCTLYAGRGFEWGIDSVKLDLHEGLNDPRRLTIRREVDTAGYVACDTHIHTFTYSRHGDATLAERMITLAGEGIELPIATDHNLTVDYEKQARAAGVRKYFTPVTGNEVTTAKLGHFNVFPLEEWSPLIDFRAPTWEKLFGNIDSLAPGAVVILNHARDDHGGFRPFDPSRHISLTGEDLDGQAPRANAMEIINSGATLNDPMMLVRDWMGCVNRGHKWTPIGASDSHDVSRFIVGQGRTYVRVDDKDPGAIDVVKAVDAIKAGHVLVSYGLLVDLRVNDRFTSGDLAKIDGDINVRVTVQGPAWTRADRVELYANGVKIREAQVDPARAAHPGLTTSIDWKIPKPAHDVFLTAIATGPGVTDLFWPAARPYQRTGPHWVPYVLGCSGAVFVDADRSGSFASAFDYASRIAGESKGDLEPTVKVLARYDASVAAQAAGILRARGKVSTAESLDAAARNAAPSVRDGFEAYARAWRESDAARAAKVKVAP